MKTKGKKMRSHPLRRTRNTAEQIFVQYVGQESTVMEDFELQELALRAWAAAKEFHVIANRAMIVKTFPQPRRMGKAIRK